MAIAQMSLWGGETGADLHLEIERNGYGLIEHRIPVEAIDELQEAHAYFSNNLPDPDPKTLNEMMVDTKDLDKLDFSKDTQKDWHKYRTNTPHLAKPNGYTNRFYQAEVLREFDRKLYDKKLDMWLPAYEDPKEFFHCTPSFRQDMLKQHEKYGWGPVPPEVYLLARRMHVVHSLARNAIWQVFSKLEDTHPEIKKFVTLKDLDASPLRNLLYYQGQSEVLAEEHHDRGVFTMQIADSHRGLRIRDPQTNQMVLVETPPTVSPVFPAIKWKDVTEGTSLKSLRHDVINDPTACVDRRLHGLNIARWALILFVNSTHVDNSADKSATH